jgi:hypothetical protein
VLTRSTPLRRTAIKRRPPRRTKDPAISDPKYLEWIAHLPCAVCFAAIYRAAYSGEFPMRHLPYQSDVLGVMQMSHTEAAHVGDHAAYRRASDRTAIPLCGVAHHREGPESHHKLTAPGAFWKRHGLDRGALITALNAEFERSHK